MTAVQPHSVRTFSIAFCSRTSPSTEVSGLPQIARTRSSARGLLLQKLSKTTCSPAFNNSTHAYDPIYQRRPSPKSFPRHYTIREPLLTLCWTPAETGLTLAPGISHRVNPVGVAAAPSQRCSQRVMQDVSHRQRRLSAIGFDLETVRARITACIDWLPRSRLL
jgi:hypothetical protein